MTAAMPDLAALLHAQHAEEFGWMKGTDLSDPVPASECGNCQRWAGYVAASGLIERVEAAEAAVARVRALADEWEAAARKPKPQKAPTETLDRTRRPHRRLELRQASCRPSPRRAGRHPMTAVWVTATNGGEREYHDTQEAVESRAKSLTSGSTQAVAYRMEVEPEVRGWAYWSTRRAETAQGRPNGVSEYPNANHVVLGRNGSIQEGAA